MERFSGADAMFLHLEDPAAVNKRILEFVSS